MALRGNGISGIQDPECRSARTVTGIRVRSSHGDLTSVDEDFRSGIPVRSCGASVLPRRQEIRSGFCDSDVARARIRGQKGVGYHLGHVEIDIRSARNRSSDAQSFHRSRRSFDSGQPLVEIVDVSYQQIPFR